MSTRIVRSYAERMAGYRRVLEARDTTTSTARFLDLAADAIRPVRLHVARSPSAPASALVHLANDDDSSVRWNVLHNPNLPMEGLQLLADREQAETGSGFIIRERVLAHPNCGRRLRKTVEQQGARSGPSAAQVFERIRNRR